MCCVLRPPLDPPARRPSLMPSADLLGLQYEAGVHGTHTRQEKGGAPVSPGGQHERRSFKHKTARSGGRVPAAGVREGDGGGTKKGGRCSKTQEAQ